MIRIGVVNTISYEDGVLSVIYPDLDDSIIDDVPILTFNDEYKMPNIGDKVLIVKISDGTDICLGTYWEKENLPPLGIENAYCKKINEKTSIQYDVNDKSLVLEAERIKFKAISDGIEITLKDLMNRIEKLEGGGTSG